MTSLGDIFADDQREAERREARKLARSLASDVVTYRNVLKGAGVPDPLLTTLVAQFNERWVTQIRSDVEVDVSYLLEDD